MLMYTTSNEISRLVVVVAREPPVYKAEKAYSAYLFGNVCNMSLTASYILMHSAATYTIATCTSQRSRPPVAFKRIIDGQSLLGARH